MKTLSIVLIYITSILSSTAYADGLGGLAGLDGVAFLFIIMGASAAILIAWLFISIKYIIIKKYNFNTLQIITYIILSTTLAHTCMFIANIIRSPENYLFYLCSSVVIVGTLFSLFKIKQIKSLAINE